MTRSIRTLMEGLVDYAGLFPPASLAMKPTVENFARDRMGAHAWALGRIICPASRLEELSQHGAPLMPGTHATSGYREHADALEPWRVAVVCDMPVEAALDAMDAFNEHHAGEDHGLATADTIEIRVANVGEIDDALDRLPEDIYPYFEFPVSGDCRGFVAAVAGNDAGAKIRCGGVTPEAFPSAEQVAAFLHACTDARVAFKATAGLHHPVRAEHPVSDEPGAIRVVMHGYMNLFLAAALLMHDALPRERTAELLLETDARAFTFNNDRAEWRGHGVDLSALNAARQKFAHSYGSCSFDDPIRDAQALAWL